MKLLKPCPFCGCDPTPRTRYHSMLREPTFQIQCAECYCGTSGRYQTIELAAAAWNARVEHKSHKVMTPVEYSAMPIKGWHEVCRDVDGHGGVGVRFLGQ